MVAPLLSLGWCSSWSSWGITAGPTGSFAQQVRQQGKPCVRPMTAESLEVVLDGSRIVLIKLILEAIQNHPAPEGSEAHKKGVVSSAWTSESIGGWWWRQALSSDVLCRAVSLPAGFGVPNRRRRIFILASMHGDARDVLLGQVGAGFWRDCAQSTQAAVCAQSTQAALCAQPTHTAILCV